MITSLFYIFIISGLSALIYLLPDATALPSSIQNGINWINSGFNFIGFLFPLNTFFQILIAGLAIEVAIWTFKWANWLINKIRGSG